ncbi:hypothetical protein [Yersinia phage vB_YenM_P778]
MQNKASERRIAKALSYKARKVTHTPATKQFSGASVWPVNHASRYNTFK